MSVTIVTNITIVCLTPTCSPKVCGLNCWYCLCPDVKQQWFWFISPRLTFLNVKCCFIAFFFVVVWIEAEIFIQIQNGMLRLHSSSVNSVKKHLLNIPSQLIKMLLWTKFRMSTCYLQCSHYRCNCFGMCPHTMH